MTPLVVVAGALANKPGNGGEAWVRASWLRGLARLGCRVAFVEEIAGGTPVQRRWFEEVTADLGLADRSALLCDGEPVVGLSRADVADLLRDADLLVNISGNLSTPRLLDACDRRVYVDIDPGFTQLWAAGGEYARQLEAHHLWFTVGGNIGTGRCAIPTGGTTWHHAWPPVVLDDWPVAPARSGPDGGRRFSTVATWRGPYGPVEWDGMTLGSKVHEFRRFVELPSKVDARFELALAIHEADRPDRDLLERHGWAVVDPSAAVGTPASFAAYVRAADAEFSVAQSMYVHARTGWFSDRSVRYLASGRPVLVQDTGFSDLLPAGCGLVAFSTMAEAVSGAESILADYPAHSRAARRLAEELFDSDRVLSDFLTVCLP